MLTCGMTPKYSRKPSINTFLFPLVKELKKKKQGMKVFNVIV